jgi:hypothetical protein
MVDGIIYVRDYALLNISDCKLRNDHVCEYEGTYNLSYIISGEYVLMKTKVLMKLIIKKISNNITLEFNMLDPEGISTKTIGSTVLRMKKKSTGMDIEVNNGGIRIKILQ